MTKRVFIAVYLQSYVRCILPPLIRYFLSKRIEVEDLSKYGIQKLYLWKCNIIYDIKFFLEI